MEFENFKKKIEKFKEEKKLDLDLKFNKAYSFTPQREFAKNLSPKTLYHQQQSIYPPKNIKDCDIYGKKYT